MVISNIYFIRLGAKNSYAEECLKNNTLKLGFTTNQHKESLNGDWDKLRQYWIKKGKSKGKATEYMHETQKFYEANDSVLWITTFNGHLYWAQSKKVSEKNKLTKQEKEKLLGNGKKYLLRFFLKLIV